MNDNKNPDKEANTSDEPIVNAGEVHDAPVDTPDEIKSQIEGDIDQIKEKQSASEKDWVTEFKTLEEKYMRLYADFENLKRRTANERIELFRTANQEVLVSLLPVLDDFERALRAMQANSDTKAIREGVELVQNKLKSILQSKGLKAMESVGKDFDTNYHEAITKVPAPSETLKGKVVDEVEKGYFLGDKVIRYAKVVVGE